LPARQAMEGDRTKRHTITFGNAPPHPTKRWVRPAPTSFVARSAQRSQPET
jgi:hypothetical protein